MTLTFHLERLGTPERSFLKSLHLSVKPGEILTLMGPSGCGKSSLLAAIAGTLGEGIRFDGSVHLDGEPIDQLPTHRRGVGLLFQDDLLFAHMSVAENLLFALPAGPRAPRAARGRSPGASRVDHRVPVIAHTAITTFPKCCPAARCRKASGALSNGNTESTIGRS